MKTIYVALVALLMASALAAAEAPTAENTEQAINYLLEYIAKSDCQFIRNGEANTGKAAADHIRSKYQNSKDVITSPEDFIRLCATKSSLSGKPYMVVPKGGKEIRSDEWLTAALKTYRSNKEQSK